MIFHSISYLMQDISSLLMPWSERFETIKP